SARRVRACQSPTVRGCQARPPVLPVTAWAAPHTSPLSLHDALPISGDESIIRMNCCPYLERILVLKKSGGRCGLHGRLFRPHLLDRKSTRLNSSHVKSSYAVSCLTKNTTPRPLPPAVTSTGGPGPAH